MSESPPEARGAGPPGEKQPTPPDPRKAGRPVPVGGALIVGLVAVSALVALYLERKPPLNLVDAVHQIEKRVEAKRRPKWLDTLRRVCARHDCACARKAASLGLDVDATDSVLDIVSDAVTCPAEDFAGLRAEALIRKGDEREGLKAIQQSDRNAYTTYAEALLSYRAKQLDPAMALAEASERAGRGWSATLLIGLIAYEAGDFERARRTFRVLLKDDPDDLDALWNLAVTAQKEDRYGEARSSYLKVLRLRPAHADARHNLAVLAHSVGALDEARHNVEKLRRLGAPKARIAELEALLAAPPPNPALRTLTLGGTGSPSSSVGSDSPGPTGSAAHPAASSGR